MGFTEAEDLLAISSALGLDGAEGLLGTSSGLGLDGAVVCWLDLDYTYCGFFELA